MLCHYLSRLRQTGASAVPNKTFTRNPLQAILTLQDTLLQVPRILVNFLLLVLPPNVCLEVPVFLLSVFPLSVYAFLLIRTVFLSVFPFSIKSLRLNPVYLSSVCPSSSFSSSVSSSAQSVSSPSHSSLPLLSVFLPAGLLVRLNNLITLPLICTSHNV